MGNLNPSTSTIYEVQETLSQEARSDVAATISPDYLLYLQFLHQWDFWPEIENIWIDQSGRIKWATIVTDSTSLQVPSNTIDSSLPVISFLTSAHSCTRIKGSMSDIRYLSVSLREFPSSGSQKGGIFWRLRQLARKLQPHWCSTHPDLRVCTVSPFGCTAK